MLAAHRDQENRVHGQQTAAAAKPLNQGIKGLNPKTPGNKAPKTPFKVPLNDENLAGRVEKSALKINGKGNENLLQTSKKGGKLDQNAFITPAGPRHRAPLGMKTTNAKGTAFQTPGPLSAKTQQKSRSPRLRRAKVKVLHAEAEVPLVEDDEPEIEYMPPREKPLPDLHEDHPPDLNLSMFDGANYTRGFYSHYFNEIDEHGISKQQRERDAAYDKDMEQLDKDLEKACDDGFAQVDEELNDLRLELGIQPIPVRSQKQAKNLAAAKSNVQDNKAPSTFHSKHAASALSKPAKSTPNFAAPTAAAKARGPSSTVASKKPIPQSSTHAVASAASHSSIGYSNGRAVSSNLRRPAASTTRSLNPRGTHSRSSSQATITPSQFAQKSEYSGTTVRSGKALTAAEETRWLEELRMNEITKNLGGDDVEECMRGNLIFGDDVFEDFQMVLPEEE